MTAATERQWIQNRTTNVSFSIGNLRWMPFNKTTIIWFNMFPNLFGLPCNVWGGMIWKIYNRSISYQLKAVQIAPVWSSCSYSNFKDYFISLLQNKLSFDVKSARKWSENRNFLWGVWAGLKKALFQVFDLFLPFGKNRKFEFFVKTWLL